MQPSITPSPSARAACAMRTPSRIPPDFASLMLIPCAIGRTRRRRERVAVLVDVDRDGDAAFSSRRPVAGRERLLAVLDAELASCGSASSASSSVHHSLTSTWSGTSVDRPDGAHAVDDRAVAAAELQLQR
jgi:hypothetical protein